MPSMMYDIEDGSRWVIVEAGNIVGFLMKGKLNLFRSCGSIQNLAMHDRTRSI